MKEHDHTVDANAKAPSYLPINEVLTAFVIQLYSLKTAIPLVWQALVQSRIENLKEALQFLNTHNLDNPGKEPKEADHYIIERSIYTHYSRLDRQGKNLELACSIVPASFLVSLVSQYDSFLGNLLRSLFYSRPELLLSSERPLTFKELTEFETLDDARSFIVEKEVETVIRKSHQEQFDWLENKFKSNTADKFTLRKNLSSWPVFIELTERRNLFVHCNGIVSSQYIRICAVNGVNTDVKVGERLTIDEKYPEYLTRAWECIFEIAFKLTHVLWRKLLPEQQEAADKSLVEISYDLLVNNYYRLAINILEFATQILKKYSSEHTRRTLIINKAQAYKWAGDNNRAKQVVAEEDWSSTSDKFTLGIMVINDNFKDAAIIMEKIGANAVPDEHAYQTWPLFKEFRDSPEFAIAYGKIFGKPFATVEEIIKKSTFATALKTSIETEEAIAAQSSEVSSLEQ